MTLPQRAPSSDKPAQFTPDPSAVRNGLPLDVFDGFFFEEPDEPTHVNGLLDIEPARRWLQLVGWGAQTGLYTYQLPLDSVQGPRVEVHGHKFLMLSSYDYLALAGHPYVQQETIAAVQRHGSGTGGVRLLTGTADIHRQLERDLANFKGTEAALVFSSGYMAALGTVGALFGPRDRALLDERAHRSIVDACVLARVPFRRFRHNDPQDLENELHRASGRGRTLVVIEGVYSMDGDVAPLPAIADVARAHGAYIMVDEAHSFGIMGASGRGIDEHFGLTADRVDIWLGSLSKAIPSCGGFVAARQELIIYLQHGAAPFMFSAAQAPPCAGAARAAIEVLQREPWRVSSAHENAAYLREGLAKIGFDVGESESCIIPVILGSNEAAFETARALLDRGVLASAVIPPAVPRVSARLRLCATAAHTRADMDEALGAFEDVRSLSLLSRRDAAPS
jgi:glycine C-acetyltransferase